MRALKQEFWVMNITKKDIALSDLGVIIRAKTTVNLLDHKHYNCTVEQLQKSLENGSLYQKKGSIFKRNTPPILNSDIKIVVDRSAVIPTRARSVYELKQEHYEELSLSDEEFAEQNADVDSFESKKDK